MLKGVGGRVMGRFGPVGGYSRGWWIGLQKKGYWGFHIKFFESRKKGYLLG